MKGWQIGMSSDFRRKARKYWICCILDKTQETVYVYMSYAKNPKTQYYAHMRGEISLTRDDYLDADITKPEFLVLETIYCVGRIAFKHVLAWYHYFEEQGYAIIVEEKMGNMEDFMGYESQKIYDEVCAPFSLDEVLTRKVEEPVLEREKEKGKQEKEKLVQFNVRVKESVAQAYRLFCAERGITQSDGLRLLLMGEDFTERDLMMQSYQKEFGVLKEKYSQLKKQNKELLEFKKGEESWVMHQRKAWINIAESMLNIMIRRYVGYRDDLFEESKSLSFKSEEGYEMFCNHDYPLEGGCYGVYITGRVRGLQSNKTNAEQSSHTFICGELEDNTRVKFRWINKKQIIGIKPNDYEVTYWGPNWLIGCIISKDGATDLVCAVPLCGIDRIDSFRFNMRIEAEIEAELKAMEKIIEAKVEAELLALEDGMNTGILVMENENGKPKLDTMIAAADRKKRK